MRFWKIEIFKKKPKKEIEGIPGFEIKKIERIFELPEIKDITKINVIYPLIEPFAYVNIKWDPNEKLVIYNLIEPKLEENEKKLFEKIYQTLIELIEVGLTKIKNLDVAMKYLQKQVLKVLDELGIKLTANQFTKIMYYVYRDFIGLNEIEPLLNDPNIEDISCDGIDLPIYVVHRKYGSLKTNIIFKDIERLRDLVIKLAERCGRYVSYAEPILAGTLPDGSRVSATLASDVATRGPVFTIRKFGTKPFSPIDQIELKTADSEIMAYLWYLVEHKASILIAGGVATGKTSFLNSIGIFIQPEAKIVCTTKNSNIILNDHIQKIGDFVEERIKKENYVNENGMLILHLKNQPKFYAFNTEAFRIEKQNIKTAIKLKAPEKLVRITTEYGTYIDLTPNTKIPVIKGEKFSFTEAVNVDKKCYVPQVSKINFQVQFPYFDPLAFAKKHCLRVKIRRELLEKCAEKIGGVNKLLKKLKWRAQKFYNKSFFVEELFDVVDEAGLERNIIKEYLVGIGKYKSMQIFTQIPPEIFYVAGLLQTDGHLAKNRKSLMFEQIRNKNIQQKCSEILSKYFGPTKKERFYSEVAWHFFNEIFEIPTGKKSGKIKVPKIVMNAPFEHVYAYLKGVIDGDGSIDKHTITIFSKSKDFAEGLIHLLLRLGIVATYFKTDTKTKGLHCVLIQSKYYDMLAEKLGIGKRNLRCFRKSSDVMLPIEIGLILKRIMKENKLPLSIFNDLKTQGILAHLFYDKKRRLIKKDIILFMLKKLRKMLPENQELIQLEKILESDDIIWSKVKEKKIINSKKEKFVFDLTPEKTEYFPAGCFGFIIIQDSIEDTREIKLVHEHWIPGLARVGFGIPTPTGEKYGEVTLFDLLKESFRQNPDYVIVGEVRGKETYVMFQGMASLPSWEKVAILNNFNLNFKRIGDLDPGKEYHVYSIDPLTERAKILPAKAIVNHGKRSLLYKIKTKSGREVLVTPDHSIFTYNGKIEPVVVSEIKAGDKIVLPTKIPCGYNDLKYLNLIELFPNIRVFAPDLIRKACKKLGIEKSSNICKVKTISDYYSRKKNGTSALKAKKFLKLMKEAEIGFKLEKLRVKFERKSKSLPAIIKICPELLRLLGYYISEGSLSRANRISIYNKDKKVLKDVEKCIRRVVGKVKIRKRNTKGFGGAVEISFNHKVLYELLKKCCGRKSKERKIPSFIFGLSERKIGEFLYALYAGNGWLSSRKVIGYSTRSKQLANDLLYLLLSIGVFGRKKNHGKDIEILIHKNEDKKKFIKVTKLWNIKFGKVKERRNDILLDEIVEVRKVALKKPVEVFDISVPKAENFIGGFGGVLLHNSGHPCISTFHGGSLDAVVKRLIAPPISLPITLLESLDVVVVMVHAKEKGKSARRIKEIIEIVKVDPKTDEITTNVVYVWDPVKDSYKKVNESVKIEKFALAKGATKEDALREIEKRKKIIERLGMLGIKDYLEVSRFINTYYKEPKKALEEIKIEEEKIKVEVPKIEKIKEEKEREARRKKVLEALGFKMISE